MMGFYHSPSLVTNGLVLCLDAGNTKSYPGTGTAWNDLSGRGINGTLQNGVGYNSSSGGALTFDGSNDYVSFASSSSIQFLNRDPYTLESWFFVSTAPTNFTYPGLFHREGTVAGGRSGWMLLLARNDGNLVYIGTERWQSGAAQSVFYNTDATTIVNRWWHSAATYDGTNLTLYINGFSEGTTTSTTNITNSTSTLDIGRLYPANVLNGRIGNCRIYNRALTAAEVAQNFNVLRGRYGL